MADDQLEPNVAGQSSNEQQEASGSNKMTAKRSDYISWEEYFMALAIVASKRSKDPVKQVGACIVSNEKKIVNIGYNGMPIGCSDDVFPWGKNTSFELDEKKYYVCHAELNAIVIQNSGSVKDCTMYVTLFPCHECAKLIIQSGIKEVVYFSDEKATKPSTMASRRMFEAVGITVRQFIAKRKEVVVDFMMQ